MAIVVRDSRNRSPFWYACYTTADGRRLKKSTKQTDQRKAKLVAEALQRAEGLAKDRELTELRTRELLSDVLSAQRRSTACIHGRGMVRSFRSAETQVAFGQNGIAPRADDE